VDHTKMEGDIEEKNICINSALFSVLGGGGGDINFYGNIERNLGITMGCSTIPCSTRYGIYQNYPVLLSWGVILCIRPRREIPMPKNGSQDTHFTSLRLASKAGTMEQGSNI